LGNEVQGAWYNSAVPPSRHFRVVLSATCHRALLRRLRRAIRPKGYDLPETPRLARGRLESLLDVVEEADLRQRAAWLDARERELSTLHAFLGWGLRNEVGFPSSARPLHERVEWVIGLD
jgi:hypothetical protein